MQLMRVQEQGGAAAPGKARYDYAIENFRGLAICLVIATHLGTVETLGPASKYLLYLFKDGTSWFVFISGYLFYLLEQARFRYRDYLAKKCRFVLLPYLLLSIGPIAAGIAIQRPELMGLSRSGYAMWSLAVGGSVISPMWFIPMIALFFLLSPLLRVLSRSRWLVPATIAAVLFSLFSGRPFQNMNPFLSFLHFLGFYLLGITLAAHAAAVERVARSRHAYWIIGACLVLFVAGGVLYQPRSDPGFFASLGKLHYVQLGKLTLLVATLLAFKRMRVRRNAVLSYLADRSFGLFFIHGFCILLFGVLVSRAGAGAETLPYELAVVAGGAVVLVELVKRILGKRSRYVIGC